MKMEHQNYQEENLDLDIDEGFDYVSQNAQKYYLPNSRNY